MAKTDEQRLDDLEAQLKMLAMGTVELTKNVQALAQNIKLSQRDINKRIEKLFVWKSKVDNMLKVSHKTKDFESQN